MARLAVTLTLLIGLFAFTEASLPLDLPNDDSSSIHDPSITLPEAESKRMILLPSEKPETEPATMVTLDHNEMDTTVKFTEPEADEITEEVEPEIFIHPRPVWTQDGDERKMFVFRRPRHRCHHPHRRPRPFHHHKFYHQFDGLRPLPELRQGEALPAGEVSYGNDMLVADPETETKTDTDTDTDTETDPDPETENGFGGEELEQDLVEIPMGHEGGGSRHAPLRWVGLHFGGRPRFPDEPDHEDGRGPHHHHHHHDHHHPDEDEDHHPDRHHHDNHEEEEQRRPGGGGLVKRMRKFLHQFDF